ncbi:mandelate racemase/muconate lactonizing enzyme family protein [Bacillus sp. KH172YL63]|uniref:mandelate racemase/muconate lactonizing enzyme family protein n=1 Tax=Bacillus sp. KH172YL63 TaxID=2709784 RepID=UPI0013E42FC5|nr:dipeptide epimerase [Bacillus sp. KH172YL63]BCB03705.1 L-Ala-D/L-Glu epimerase [Bacillus sp. KH172YL63]
MKITQIDTYRTSVPLHTPFKTALRTVHEAEAVIVKVTCDNGMTGWGEAPPTVVITGESLSSIEAAIQQVITPVIIGSDLLDYEKLFQYIHSCIIGNSSAKAAVDMAIYDCLAQNSGLPLFKYLGGYRNELETDYTVSINSPEQMGEDAEAYVAQGFHILKIKVGKDDASLDIKRIQEVRSRVGNGITLRLDANQGWGTKEAISAIRKMEDLDLGIELVEQPVPAWDIKGLKCVTDGVDTPIMADESVFSPQQAFDVLKTRSADLINIKLMKSGGIYQAEKINAMAELCGVECMVGSMIETRLGITAAAHFAASKKNITRFDFDAPLMLAKDIVKGGILYSGRKISLPAKPGLGVNHIEGLGKGKENE